MVKKLTKILLHIINITYFLASLGHASKFTSTASTTPLQSSSTSSHGTQQLQRTTISILSLGTSTAIREMTTSKLSSQDSSITSSSTEKSTWSSQQSSSRVSEIRLCATTSGNQSSSTVSGLTSTSPLPWWHWRCLYGWSTHTTNHPVSTMQMTVSSAQQNSIFTKYGSRQLTTAGTLRRNCTNDSTGLCQNLSSSIASSVTPLPAVNITAYTVVTNCWLWWWCVTTPTTLHPDSVTTMMTTTTLSSNANTSVSNVIGRCEYPLWCEESQLPERCSSVGMNATFEVVICNANLFTKTRPADYIHKIQRQDTSML